MQEYFEKLAEMYAAIDALEDANLLWKVKVVPADHLASTAHKDTTTGGGATNPDAGDMTPMPVLDSEVTKEMSKLRTKNSELEKEVLQLRGQISGLKTALEMMKPSS